MLNKPHKKLDVWQKSMNLVEIIYLLTCSFPKSEEFGIISQMKRSVVSIPSNIAEGAARQTSKEFTQFLHTAQGSLSEVDTQLEISIRLQYINRDAIEDTLNLINDIDKMLTGLIKSLKRIKHKE